MCLPPYSMLRTARPVGGISGFFKPRCDPATFQRRSSDATTGHRLAGALGYFVLRSPGEMLSIASPCPHSDSYKMNPGYLRHFPCLPQYHTVFETVPRASWWTPGGVAVSSSCQAMRNTSVGGEGLSGWSKPVTALPFRRPPQSKPCPRPRRWWELGACVCMRACVRVCVPTSGSIRSEKGCSRISFVPTGCLEKALLIVMYVVCLRTPSEPNKHLIWPSSCTVPEAGRRFPTDEGIGLAATHLHRTAVLLLYY